MFITENFLFSHRMIIEYGIPEEDTGAHLDMCDYHVYLMDDTDKDAPCDKLQMWSNDAACKDGNYYMYFPAKDKEDIFRIGVAINDTPEAPYKALPEPMKGSFSLNHSFFVDDDGTQYLFWGGLVWPIAALQNW